jgi:hypothetical protein
MNSADVARIVLELASLAAKVPDAIQQISGWVNHGAARPGELLDLPELTDLTRNDLELAALKARSSGGTGA